MSFSEYQTVRIRTIPPDDQPWRGPDDHSPPPRVGDLGTIIHVTGRPDEMVLYTVEQNLPGMGEPWIGDFAGQALEAVDADSAAIWNQEPTEASAGALTTAREWRSSDDVTTDGEVQNVEAGITPTQPVRPVQQPWEPATPAGSDPRESRGVSRWLLGCILLMWTLGIGLYLGAGGYGLFIVVAPTTWLGAAWRASLLMSGLIVIGGVLTGSRVTESLINAFFTGITFFILGGIVWSTISAMG